MTLTSKIGIISAITVIVIGIVTVLFLNRDPNITAVTACPSGHNLIEQVSLTLHNTNGTNGLAKRLRVADYYCLTCKRHWAVTNTLPAK